MNVLVIGGTGFIGLHVVRRLLHLGHEVAVFHRGETPGRLPGSVTRLHGDRDRPADVRAACEDVRPDVVLDIIPYTARQAEVLMQGLRGVAGRVVALSSGDVYRNYDGLRGRSRHPPDPLPLAETSPLRQTRFPYREQAAGPEDWMYHYDKILVEQALQGVPDVPATILRLPKVYGPGDGQRHVGTYLDRLRGGDVRLPTAQARWRWTRGYVEDVAAAIALAVVEGRAAGRVYNVGTVEAPTEQEWIERIACVAGRKADVVLDDAAPPEPPTFDWRYGLATDTRRIREELGYEEAVPPDEALRRTLAWERS